MRAIAAAAGCLLCSPYHALAPEIAASAENLAAPFGAVPIHGKPVRMSRPSALTPHRFRGRIGAWKPDTSPAGALPLIGYRHGVYGRMRHGGSTFTVLFGNCVSTLNIFHSLLLLSSHIAGPWRASIHACRKLDSSRPRATVAIRPALFLAGVATRRRQPCRLRLRSSADQRFDLRWCQRDDP